MAVKRALEFDVSEMTCPSPNAKVHGVLSSLSPMKKTKTCSFFDGQLSDGKATVRLFGFDAGVRRKLVEFEEAKQSVSLCNCEVKRSRRGNDLEILVTKRTNLEKCEKVFDVDASSATKMISLKELPGLVCFQRVSVEVKVTRVEDPLEVTGGKKKQDVIVGDSSGSARVTVWEGEIGSMEEGGSYKMTGMMVREFRGEKFLSTSKQNSMIERIADIGDVEEETEDESTHGTPSSQISGGRIVGVLQLDHYRSCLKCTAKVLQDRDDPEIGSCLKCQMMQAFEECGIQLSTQVMIRGDNGTWTLRAFGKVVEDIAQQPASTITERMLVKAKSFNVTYRDGIIQAISRQA